MAIAQTLFANGNIDFLGKFGRASNVGQHFPQTFLRLACDIRGLHGQIADLSRGTLAVFGKLSHL